MRYRDPHYCPHCKRGPWYNPGSFVRHVHWCEFKTKDERARANIAYARRKHLQAIREGR